MSRPSMTRLPNWRQARWVRFIQARNPDWVQRPFFAQYDDQATWLHHLKPAFGEAKWFWEDEYEAIREDKLAAAAQTA